MLFLIQRYAPEPRVLDGTVSRLVDPSHFSNGMRVGGSPGAISFAGDTASIEISSSILHSEPTWIGPILPIFPVLMGASSACEPFSIHVEVTRTDAPLSLRPADFRIVDSRDSREHTPARAAIDEPPDAERCERMRHAVRLDDRLDLFAGEALVLSFDVLPQVLPEFDFVFPSTSLASSVARELRVHFRRDDAHYVGWGVPR